MMKFVSTWIIFIICLTVPSIQAEWLKFNSHLYFFSARVNSTFKLTYSSAEQYCISQQAHLASVLDQQEADYISNNMNAQHGKYGWIGLQYSGDPVTNCDTCPNCDHNNPSNNNNCKLCYTCRDQWKWLDGSAMNWTNWHGEQPNENVNCGVMIINNPGKWYDRICDDKLSFICKKAEVPSITTSMSPPPSTSSVPTNMGMSTSTPSSYSNTTSDTGKSVGNMDSSNIGLVAGVVVAVLVAVFVSLVVIGLIIKRKRDKKMQDPQKRKKLDHTTSYENVGDMYSYAYANPVNEDIQIQENGTEYAEFDEQQDTSYADINDNKANITSNTNVHNSTETEYTNTAPDGVTPLDNVSELYAVPDKTNKQKYNNKPKPEKPKRKKKPVKVQEDIPDSKIDIEAMYAQPMKKKK